MSHIVGLSKVPELKFSEIFKKMDNIVQGLNFRIKPNYVFVQPEYVNSRPRSRKNSQKSLANLLCNKTNGQLSNKAKQKLQHACNWLIYSSLRKKGFSKELNKKFIYKVSFITLTIPPQENTPVTHRALKKILNSWLTYQKIYFKLNNYVWKVEKHKDGRLHIHILTDTFLWHVQIRKSWNRLLQKNGLLEFHFQKFGDYNPNSTDVHAVKKVKNMSAYIAKYMSKDNEHDEGFNGRIWACSYKISAFLKANLYLDLENTKEIMSYLIQEKVEWKIIGEYDKMGNLTKKFGEMFFLKIDDWINMQGNYLGQVFRLIIEKLRPNNLFSMNY